jgi:glucokinase
MVVTVSSGIGSKIYDRKHSDRVLDSPAWAGEIGHVVVDDSPAAPVCDCGAAGHLGAIASGRGVERYARRAAAAHPAAFDASALASRFGATAGELTNEAHLVPAALAGDPWTLMIVRKATQPLARLLVHTAVATGLDQIIIIGGFALALGDVYRGLLRTEMARYSRYPLVDTALDTMLELGNFADEACLLGAVTFGWHHWQLMSESNSVT